MITKNKNHIKGFTLVEILVSILISSIAVSSIAFAIAKGVQHTESIRLKGAAHIALKNYTEKWKSYVAFGYEPMTGTRSEEINLTSKVISKNGENLETLLQSDPNATDAILYREISRVSIPNRPLSEYWNIKTWIRWKRTRNISKI